MPIKWSALKVSEAMDMVEGFVTQAVEPLEQARLVLQEARKIPDLPGYVTQFIARIEDEINRAIGDGLWGPAGNIRTDIEKVRKSLPDGAVDEERKRAVHGSTTPLF